MNGNNNPKRPLRVAELFAGVGGFRHGLQAVRQDMDSPCFDVRWSNQWEPSTRAQHAAEVYKARWGAEGFVNKDLFAVLNDATEMDVLKAAAPDVLVGGFPCQDYSVARPLNQSQGLEGKKGVLWWAVYQVLQRLLEAGQPAKYLILENVGRILSTPTQCKGRDFAVILASLQSLGYAVEWRIVNAADYGFPQRRMRIFMVAYHASTPTYQNLIGRTDAATAKAWLSTNGTLAQALPAEFDSRSVLDSFLLAADAVVAQAEYTSVQKKSRFKSAGLCIDGQVWTGKASAAAINDCTRYVGQVRPMTLGDVVADTAHVPDSYVIDEAMLPRWQYLKGAKSVPRVHHTGFEYDFTEGAVGFPDSLDEPSRTVITSEGGQCASRTKHVIQDFDGRLRRLLPEELEVLNGFPRGFTAVPRISDVNRAFLMGNALVTGVVRSIGAALYANHAECRERSLIERVRGVFRKAAA